MSDMFDDEFDFADEYDSPSEKKKPVKKQPSSNINQAGRAGQKTTRVVPNPNETVKKPKSRNQRQQSGVQQPQGGTSFKEPSGQRNKVQSKQIMPDEIAQPTQQNDVVLPSNGGKKKKGFLGKVIGVIVIALVALIGLKLVSGLKQEPQEIDYESTGKAVYDSLQDALSNYNAEKVDDLVGSEDGDSYLAQEWAYANSNAEREKFILLVTSVVKFKYPQMEQRNTKGGIMKDKSGNPIMIESTMDNGEKVTVELLDYAAISDMIKNDVENIETMMVAKGISKENYDYQNECIDLLMSWVTSQTDLPTTEKEIQLRVEGGKFKDDIALDKLLFSSDDFHAMCDEFDKIVTEYKDTRDEVYYEEEEVHNDEYDEWYKLFKKYYDADNGKFKKGVSKWEPWYKRDKNNKFVLDKKGNKVVNYYSIKDKNGNDWIQPSETVFKKVKKTKQVPVEYISEYGVTHCFLGAYYCQNEYVGVNNAEVKVGDGTLEHPAGVGTPIITKVLCKDGKYHDVRITMKGYWNGEDAIKYAGTFSEKNRGFDPRSVVQLICYEIEVENLENKPITFDSEMVLCDANSNQSPRTGTMYEFLNENITIKGKESKVINDWATSTEIEQKYVIWGKSFNRQYSVVYFKVLAGTGDVPTYSAYKAFTGESYMSGSSSLERLATPTPEPTPEPTIDSEYDTSSEGSDVPLE